MNPKQQLYRRREIAAWLSSDPHLIGNSGGTFDHRLALQFITGRPEPDTSRYGKGKYNVDEQRAQQ